MILISLFQYLLRPSAAKDLKKILNIAQKGGDIDIKKRFLVYETPLFEQELFRITNVPCFENWRIADLLIISKKYIYDSISSNPDSAKWVRFIYSGQLIAIKLDKDYKPLTIKYPYSNKDANIRSVSNRDKTRKRLNFTTSRNKGLIVTGSNKLIEIFSQLISGKNLPDIVNIIGLSDKELITLLEILNLINNTP